MTAPAARQQTGAAVGLAVLATAAAARTAHAAGALVAGYRLSFQIATGIALLAAAVVAVQLRSGDCQDGLRCQQPGPGQIPPCHLRKRNSGSVNVPICVPMPATGQDWEQGSDEEVDMARDSDPANAPEPGPEPGEGVLGDEPGGTDELGPEAGGTDELGPEAGGTDVLRPPRR